MNAIGTLQFESQSVSGDTVCLTLGKMLRIPSFRCRTLSLHALEAMGFVVCQMLYGEQSALYIRQRRDNKSKAMVFPLVRHNSSDFLRIKIVYPSRTSSRPAHGVVQVSAVNLATRLKGSQLWWLWHARLGCPGHSSHKMMFDKKSVEGIANLTDISEPLDGVTCPICYSELTRKPDSHPTQYTIITVKGAKWNADLDSIRFILYVVSSAFLF